VIDPQDAAKRLGGEARGPSINCPGPGHSRHDRSLHVTISPLAPDGFTVKSFGGNDWQECKDHVRRELGLPEFGSRRSSVPVDREAQARKRAEAQVRAATEDEQQIGKARWLWGQSQPIRGTAADHYLRGARKITVVPPTARFVPASDRYPPSLIVAYGVPKEGFDLGAYDPLLSSAVQAVHVTRLLHDGSGREPGAKKMLGRPGEWPVALIPPNDRGELVVAEGVETALSFVHLGVGIWAAGSKDRLPVIAPAIAAVAGVRTVTISPDEDDPAVVGGKTSRVRAEDLAERLAELRPEIQTRIA
jgi:hypothetical protein